MVNLFSLSLNYMITQWKKHDERRHALIFCLIAIITCTVLITLVMIFQLPFPKELKAKKKSQIHSYQLNNFHINIPDSEFISKIRQFSLQQYQYYQEACKESDVLRPLTHICRNFTQSFETSLSYLAVSQLLNQNDLTDFQRNLKSLTFKKKIGIEIGRISDFVIAPLISAYYTSKNDLYLQHAVSLCKELLEFITPEKPIPAPFIGYETEQQHFGQAEVFIDDVSSAFPVLASIAYLTQDSIFFNPVQNFVAHIRNSIFKPKKMKEKKKNKKKESDYFYFNSSNVDQFDKSNMIIPIKFSLNDDQIGISASKFDFPYRLFADLNRITRILPSIKTDDIIKVGINLINADNPTVVYNENYVKIISIEPCWFSSMLRKNNPLYSLLVKKCKSMIKRKPTPSRMNGNCEFGGYNLLTQFEFDGEILEILWRNENIIEAKNLILSTIKDCTYDGYITGLRNTTFEGKRSDNFLHPQFFSRWALNAVLIESGIKYDDIVLSDNGNILKM